MVQRQIGVGERLRFDALRGIDHEQRAFTRLQAARNLVGEVDVARRVDQVELILLAVLRLVIQPNSMGLDRDAALALQVHRVENLLHHFALRQGPGVLEQAVGKRRLAVVDMRDDREISDVLGVHAV